MAANTASITPNSSKATEDILPKVAMASRATHHNKATVATRPSKAMADTPLSRVMEATVLGRGMVEGMGSSSRRRREEVSEWEALRRWAWVEACLEERCWRMSLMGAMMEGMVGAMMEEIMEGMMVEEEVIFKRGVLSMGM